MKPNLKLRFRISEISQWAENYEYGDDAPFALVAAVSKRGYLTKDEFMAVCHWKSPRTQPRCATNQADFIKEVTRCALGNSSEQMRIEVLTLLNGVSWPTASVILHFFHSDPYPIVDIRALWSLSCKVPSQYDFPFWQAYTDFCRKLAKESGVSMRVLDRALWQYSKEKQR